MFYKNQEVEVTIEDMSVNGEGIGHAYGMTLFVKGAVVGDKIIAGITKVKKNLCYARVVKLIKPSAYRSTEVCPKAKPCGGCQLQALNYDKQLELKANHVRNNLIRVGGFSEDLVDNAMESIIGMEEPYYYRNKLQIPVGLDKNGNVVMGFYLSHSHDIIPIDKCYLSHPVIDSVISIIREWIVSEKVSIYKDGQGVLRHILIRYGFYTREIMVCLIGNVKLDKGNLDWGNKAVSQDVNKIVKNSDQAFFSKLDILVDKLQEVEGMTSIVLNSNRRNTNVILGDETAVIWGSDTITDYIGDKAFNISAKSFYQVNPIQTKKLYDKVAEYASLTGSENVWDLYCGIGTIGIYLSDKAKSVFGVEVVPQAIEDAIENAKLNDISNAEFLVGKVEDIINDIKWSDSVGVYKCDASSPKSGEISVAKPDVIVVDPPRKGCDTNCINAILKLKPERVVYVSCNPSTLARDLQILCEKEYILSEVTPVDMFPQTGHVECVCLLNNKFAKAKDFVEIEIDAEDYYRVKDLGKTME